VVDLPDGHIGGKAEVSPFAHGEYAEKFDGVVDIDYGSRKNARIRYGLVRLGMGIALVPTV
jgi:hypothetical protein